MHIIKCKIVPIMWEEPKLIKINQIIEMHADCLVPNRQAMNQSRKKTFCHIIGHIKRLLPMTVKAHKD